MYFPHLEVLDVSGHDSLNKVFAEWLPAITGRLPKLRLLIAERIKIQYSYIQQLAQQQSNVFPIEGTDDSIQSSLESCQLDVQRKIPSLVLVCSLSHLLGHKETQVQRVSKFEISNKLDASILSLSRYSFQTIFKV